MGGLKKTSKSWVRVEGILVRTRPMYISLPLHITCSCFSLFQFSDGLKSVTTDFSCPSHVCMYYRAAVLNANLTTKLNPVKHEAFASARDVPYWSKWASKSGHGGGRNWGAEIGQTLSAWRPSVAYVLWYGGTYHRLSKRWWRLIQRDRVPNPNTCVTLLGLRYGYT